MIDFGPHFWLYFTLIMAAGALCTVLLTLLLTALLPEKKAAQSRQPEKSTPESMDDLRDRRETRTPTDMRGHRLAG